MTSLSNVRIGIRIGLVLGGIALVLAGLSALSLWGVRTIGRLADDSTDRLRKVELTEVIAGSESSLAYLFILLNQMVHYGELRNSALEEFKVRAKTPEEIQQSAEFIELARRKTASSDRVLDLVRAGKSADANRLSRVKSGLKEKAKEASDRETRLVDENEKIRRQTDR